MEKTRYDLPAQALHWATAFVIIAAWGLTLVIDGMPRGPEKAYYIGLHKSLGVTTMALVLLRLVWRRLSPPPALPENMSGLLQSAAAAAHIGLYLLMILLPVSGVVMSQANERPVAFFGLFTLPTLIGPDKDLGHDVKEAHELLGNLLMLLVFLHAAAALFHQHILKDGLMLRMLPGRASTPQE